MVSALRKVWVALLVGCVMAASTAGVAQAVNAPKWVAALHVEAQKMVGLRWMPVPGATGYKVLRSTTQGSGYAEIASTAAPQHFDKELEPGTTYYYVLQAVAGAEASANSGEKKVVIPGVKKVEKMKPPEWDQANVTTSTEFGKTTYKAGLLWKPVRGSLAYNIFRSTVSGKDYQLVSSGTEARFIDTDVKPGTTYYYVLTALDQTFQETPYSAEKQLEVKVVEVVKKVRKKKKVYPKLVPIPTAKGDVQKLPSGPFDSLIDDGGVIYVAAARLYSMDSFGDDYTDVTPEGITAIMNVGLGIDGEILATVLNSRKVIIIDGPRVKEFEIPSMEKPLVNSAGKQMPIKEPIPIDVTQNIDGKYWVTDNSNNRVVIFDEDLEFLGNAAADTPQELLFNATSINHDSKGNVFAACGGVNYVNIYDADGNWTGQFGETGNIAGSFGRIGGIFVDAEDNLWVTDMFNATVQKFDNTGKFLGALSAVGGKGGLGVATPNSVSFDPEVKQGFITQGIDNSLQYITIQ